MNRKQALENARRILAAGNIDDAPLEGEILLRHVLGIDRARLFAGLEQDITDSQDKSLKTILQRRLQGEPAAYITGHREFFGLDFNVDRNVLIPRPETELLVEKAIRISRRYKVKTIADIGTGCGAIAVSLAVNLPGVVFYATDVSQAALEVAGANGQRHGVAGRIVFLRGDMLSPLAEPVDMIIANLPYVSAAELSQNSPLRSEPRLALNGGVEGLDGIQSLCLQAGEKLNDRGWLLLEIGQGQADAVTEFLYNAYPSARIELESDLAGIERVVTLRLTHS